MILIVSITISVGQSNNKKVATNCAGGEGKKKKECENTLECDFCYKSLKGVWEVGGDKFFMGRKIVKVEKVILWIRKNWSFTIE